MKIAYDAKRYYHNRTGLGNYSRTLVSCMTSRHEDVEAVLYDSKAIERTFRLGRKAAEEGCQLFHGLSNELPRDIVKAGIPSIVTMHDVAWRTFPDMYKPWDRLIYDWKYGWSAKHASHVVCISESTKRDVMRYYGVPENRISVIYQPVQEVFYTTPPPALPKGGSPPPLGELERGFLLTVGSINSRKNLMGMVKALEMIAEDERPLLVVVGNGREYRRRVEQYISEHHLQEWVRIESDIHDAETLRALYANALCLLYPSFYEGFGLPVVEASLQRCPVITSNVSSLPEAAGPDSIQVDPSSPEEIAEALHRLLTDEAERRQRGEAGYKYCMEHFHPDVLTGQMYGLYEKMLRVKN
ncbi:MAG: glycosyltransferase family 4 protein [Prevotella sp.]|nr:glycosyltransferase family 4 protein [Prevotella sp.]